jgi:hypothetical protein
MFSKGDLKTLKLNDNNYYWGMIRYNENLINQNDFLKPFCRDVSPKLILKIGKRNYALSDQFIIMSLNDYYKRMNEAPKNEKERMIENYNRLYKSWTTLNQAKQNRQYKIMEDSYDEISYQLYLLGYKMSNI